MMRIPVKRSKINTGVLFIFPAILVVAFVMYFPLIYNLVLSFFDKNIYAMKNFKFSGFDKYVELFTNDAFYNTLRITLTWTAISVFFQFSIGFVFGLVMSQDFIRFKTIIRILIMLAWVVPSIISSNIFKWMYHADFGLFNYLAMQLGLISEPQSWTTSPKFALMSAIIVNVWKMFPLVLLYIEASMQSVPRELKDAAVVDGANGFRTFLTVTLPHISITCKTVLLLLVIWTMNAFTFIFVLTGGGPARSTETLAVFIYREAFINYEYSMAAATGTIMFLFVAILSTVYSKYALSGDQT
ncbi:MAG TPA: sugar ABC transporter permease [Clostridia bacterium]